MWKPVFLWLKLIFDDLSKRIMRPVSLHQFVTDYDKAESLRAIAALQLFPENHGKNLRFEMLLRKIISEGQSSKKKITRNKLQDFFKNNFQSYYMEDPVSSFFTENIIFFNGNFTVFPGINSHGTVLVNIYLESIFILNNDLPETFKETIYDGVQSVLAVCNEVAEKAALKRYIFQTSTKNTITVPSKQNYDQLCESVRIDQNALRHLSEKHRFKMNAIDHFVVNPTIDDLSDDDPENNPVAFKPVVRDDKGYSGPLK